MKFRYANCNHIATLAMAATLTVATASGCKNESGKAAPAGSASAAPQVDALAAWLKDNSKPLSLEIYEKLLLGLADCKLQQHGIDSKCEAYKNFKQARNRNTAVKDLMGMSGKLGAKHIGHKSPAVRYQAAQLMRSMFGSDKGTQKVILEAAKNEKDPVVLSALVRVVGSRHKANADVKALLLKLAEHKNERVRQEAMSWFLTSFGKGVEGTFEKVLEKVDKDPSVKVRKFLCSRLYGSSDARAIPVFEKYLTDKDSPKDVFDGCWQGTISAWTGFPKPKEPNEAAYKLTLKVLEAKPRSKERPPWAGLSTLRAAKTEYKANDKFGTEWYEKVKGWYKKDRLTKALGAVAGDEKAYWMARTGAMEVMRELGVPKADFAKIAKKYADVKQGDNWHVKRKAEEIIKKLENPNAGKPGKVVNRTPKK